MASLIRTCLGCGQSDDHPRHVVVLADPSTGEHVSAPWHMDCHRVLTGCEDCAGQLDGANGATGDALREHLTSKGG